MNYDQREQNSLIMESQNSYDELINQRYQQQFRPQSHFQSMVEP
jgi:hypothetical protein